VGTLGKAMKKNAVILQKPSGTIAVRVDLNTVQRKFYDALLYVAKQELKKDVNKNEFTISLVELKEMLRKDEIDKNNSYYIAKLRELKRKDAEYNILGKDQNDWDIEGIVSLVSDLRIKKHRKTNKVVITFEFASIIKRALVDPNGIYANINLVVVAGLKSRYAIILYEMVKDYEKVQIPEMTIEEFRKLFNIEDKYPKMPDLKRWVLDPAVHEINNSENVDFFVSYELKKEGKAYTNIKFHVKPKSKVLKLKQQAVKVIEQNVKENPDLQELLALIPSEYRRVAKLITMLEATLKEKNKKYVKAQIEYTLQKHKKGKVKNFVVYLKKAIEEDYANFEEVDDIGFVTPEDAIGFRGDIKYKGKKRYVEIAHIEIKDLEEQGIGYDKERTYLVRLDDVDTGELVTWWEVSEKKLLEYARRNVERRKTRKEM